jgi:uncharacterized protein with PIN domain
MTFIVDGMLGKLAKWLKILGFDALFLPADDDRILAAARREGRTLLTRDRELIRRAGRHPALLIESTTWPDQVRQVLARFDLYGEARPFTRCLECNALLEPFSRAAAAQIVPPHVLEKSSSFSLCPGCGRVYWAGTHQAEMERTIRELLRNPRDTGNV